MWGGHILDTGCTGRVSDISKRLWAPRRGDKGRVYVLPTSLPHKLTGVPSLQNNVNNTRNNYLH